MPISSTKSAVLPHAFIHCTDGPTTPVFVPFAARAREAGWKGHELATGHCAMPTMLYEVAEILLELGVLADHGIKKKEQK